MPLHMHASVGNGYNNPIYKRYLVLPLPLHFLRYFVTFGHFSLPHQAPLSVPSASTTACRRFPRWGRTADAHTRVPQGPI